MEFNEVLAAAQAGGEWAFGALYRQYNPRVLRYFSPFAPLAAEDLAAETWMGVARGLRGFEGDEDRFRAWLFTIAHRQLVQQWRAAGRRRSDSTDPRELVDIPGRDDVEALVMVDSSALAAVRKLGSVLSKEQLEVVLMRVLGGLTVAQVAAVLGKRPGAVRVMQYKALRKLAAANFSVEEVTT
jgi:RNA polymerase sigma-70 factor (ECF subfamily)